MEPPCELRIIRVTWPSKDQYTDVQVAQEPITLEYGGGWLAEVPAYPKVEGTVFGQLAVAVQSVDATPALIKANGDAFSLSLIRAPDGREWWIEKGQWRKAKDGGYHDAPLSRHVGEARLQVGGHPIRLRVSPTGFTGEEFETLLDEFRNGAWQLILDPMSPTRATDRRGDGGIDPAFLEAVSAFIRYAGRAMDQPHRELREIREPQPIERVRPHLGTFRELAVRGAPRLISGRGHAPSFNTPENRQLLGMCSRLRRTLRGLLAGAEGATRDLFGRSQRAEERAAHLEASLGRARVDARRLDQLIEEREGQIKAYRRTVGQFVVEAPANTRLYSFDVEQPKLDAKYEAAGFWFSARSEHGDSEGLRLNFNTDLQTLKSVFDKRYTYRLVGAFTWERSGKSEQGRPWTIWHVDYLTDVSSSMEKQVQEEIAFLQARRSSLSERDFWTNLNKKDTDEQRGDLAEARRSAKRLRAAGEIWDVVARQLSPLADEVSALEQRARNLGIKEARQAGFTGSMTWVMNPDYRGALGAFRNALERAGLKTAELDGLLRLEDLGILDLPMVYERWCLLRIVAVLREHFHLAPPGDFRDHMLRCVTGRGALTLRFEGPSIRRDVLLEYQPRLPRRGVPEKQTPNPDFVLTVLDRDDQGPIGGNPHPCLVLDAKCKPFASLGGRGGGLSLVEELDDLIGKKGYHEPGDHRVFVLHPGPGPAAAQRVEDYCHLGGSHLMPNADDRKPWDERPPDHRYGAVLIRPGTTDPLIRLILMHLYLGLDDSLGAYKDSPAWPLICPACGSAEMTREPPPGTPKSDHPGRASWCVGCGRMLVWNFSGTCGTHLFKLGGYWTFHETHPLNPYNTRCPHCGDYMSTPEAAPEPGGFDEGYVGGEPTWPF
jgi:pyrethroid hydrolase